MALGQVSIEWAEWRLQTAWPPKQLRPQGTTHTGMYAGCLNLHLPSLVHTLPLELPHRFKSLSSQSACSFLTCLEMRIPALTEAAPILSLFSIFQKPLNNDDTRNDISESLISHPRELPGGSPFSLCKESSSTDFFNISSVEVTHQPIYMYVSFSKTSEHAFSR